MPNYSYTGRKIKVFLSHSWGKRRMEHEFAKKICDLLSQEDDVQPILDEDFFSPGISWKKIYENIVDFCSLKNSDTETNHNRAIF